MTPTDAARPSAAPVPGRAALHRWTNWLLLAGAGIFALAGLIWIGLVLFPLMSWDVYETGRLLIVGWIAAGSMAWLCNTRAYAKGKAVGEQIGYDRGVASASVNFYNTGTQNSFGVEGSHIYTTE